MITVRSFKATLVLDPADVAKWNVPETGKAFAVEASIDGKVVYVPLNAKNVRKAIAAIREAGPENMAAIISGRLSLSPVIEMREAGLVANPKTKKDDNPARKPEPVAA